MIMLDLINKILFYCKTFILLFVFTLTLYILLSMNAYYGNGISNILMIGIPLLMVLIIFVISFFFKEGDNNTFFNVACILSLIAILIIDIRTIIDKNMVLWVRGNMNFYYFQNQIKQIKILSYCIFIGNLLLIYKERKIDKKKNTKA